MNGVTVRAQTTLEDAANADAVIIGSGMKTRDVAADPALMARIRPDPAATDRPQCSGTLLLAAHCSAHVPAHRPHHQTVGDRSRR